MDRQAIGVHHRVNLARQAPRERPMSWVIVVRNTGCMLMHPDDGGIDHLHRRVMTAANTSMI